MVDLALKVGEEVTKATTEGAPGLLQVSMNINIKCDHKDLVLRPVNYLVVNGVVSQPPTQNVDYADEISIAYTSYIVRRRFEGIFICQIRQRKSKFPDDTFIIVYWEALCFGSVRIYTILVETGSSDFKWYSMGMKEQHESFRGRLKTCTKPIEESWSLGNNINIRLIANLGGDKDYNLKIAICKDEPSNEDYIPIQIVPKRQT
jgi:hypothetical protein